jgi:thioesterase domain-containing protein
LVAKGADVIVPLNAAQAEIAFYCVHSIGGEVTSFRDLARRLGSEWPIYGIQAPKESLNGAFAASVEHISRCYVEELTSFQPQGELVLGGWSVGSVIAFEMAQQLRACGREVALLVVIDGELKNTGGESNAWNLLSYWRWMRNLPRWIADDLVGAGGWRSAVRRSKGKLNLPRAKFAAYGEEPSRRHAVEGLFDTTGWPDGQLSFMRALYDAVEAYVPKIYGGRVLVYAAKTRPLSRPFPIEAAWAKVAPMIETVHVNGTHLTMVHEPSVAALAGDLRKRLDKLPHENVPTGENSRPIVRAIGEPVGASGARRSRSK